MIRQCAWAVALLACAAARAEPLATQEVLQRSYASVSIRSSDFAVTIFGRVVVRAPEALLRDIAEAPDGRSVRVLYVLEHAQCSVLVLDATEAVAALGDGSAEQQSGRIAVEMFNQVANGHGVRADRRDAVLEDLVTVQHAFRPYWELGAPGYAFAIPTPGPGAQGAMTVVLDGLMGLVRFCYPSGVASIRSDGPEIRAVIIERRD